MKDEDFMMEAIKDAKNNNHRFGAVLVKGDKIISKAGKRPKSDARYHAETQTILNAERDLNGCVLYSTCEPCIMCFYMAWVTGVSKIFYGATIKDSINEGIPEIDISVKEINEKNDRKIELHNNFLRNECLKLLREDY